MKISILVLSAIITVSHSLPVIAGGLPAMDAGCYTDATRSGASEHESLLGPAGSSSPRGTLLLAAMDEPSGKSCPKPDPVVIDGRCYSSRRCYAAEQSGDFDYCCGVTPASCGNTGSDDGTPSKGSK